MITKAWGRAHVDALHGAAQNAARHTFEPDHGLPSPALLSAERALTYRFARTGIARIAYSPELQVETDTPA